MLPTKTIVYRGGIVSFDIPAHWLEEYEYEGGGTFYEDAPDTGTLRLNVLGFRITSGVSLASRIEEIMARDGFAPFQSGLGLRRRELTGEENGEPLLFFRWEVLIPIEPDEWNVACFAHTVSESERESAATRAELEFIEASVQRAVFSRVKGYVTPKFRIESFAGAHPLRLGMTEEEIVATIGPPRTRGPNYFGDLTLDYYLPGLDLNVGIDKVSGVTTHLGFGKLSSVFFGDLDLFGDAEAWKELVRMSTDCHEWAGFIVLCDLGIQLSGFHDGDSSQLAVCVFPEGSKDKHRGRFRPFRLS